MQSEQRYSPGELYRRSRRRRSCEGTSATPRASCNDWDADAYRVEGAALPTGRAVPTEPPTPLKLWEQRYPLASCTDEAPTPVKRWEQRYPPGELYRPNRRHQS
jgi:hypothetical protein